MHLCLRSAGRPGSMHRCFSADVTRSPGSIVFRLWCRSFPQKHARRLSTEQFTCAREFRAGELSSAVHPSSTIEFKQCSSTTDFEQSRRSELERDVREEPRAVCCVPLFGGRRGAESTRRRERHRSTEYDDIAREGRESDAEFYVAAVPSEAPSPAVLRRRPRHRDVVAPADFYRASTTQSETRHCTPAAVAQVAEAAAVARSVVHVAVVCCVPCVFLLVLSFWDIPFPSHPPSFCIR